MRAIKAFKKHPIGAGPYKYTEYAPGVKLVAEAFEGYWRKVPNIKRMEFTNVPEPATRLAMVKRGEADIATLMQGVYYEDLKKTPSLRMLAPLSPVNWMVYIAAQWNPKSPWADIRVRKAASLAIDRQTLADIHMPGCGPVGTLAMANDQTAVSFPADPYDPAAAKKLLAEAGYPNGFNGGKFYPYEGGYWPYGALGRIAPQHPLQRRFLRELSRYRGALEKIPEGVFAEGPQGPEREDPDTRLRAADVAAPDRYQFSRRHRPEGEGEPLQDPADDLVHRPIRGY